MKRFHKSLAYGLASSLFFSTLMIVPVTATDAATATLKTPTVPLMGTEGQPFTHRIDAQEQVTGILVTPAAIRHSGNTPFELLSARVEPGQIVLEIAPPPTGQLVSLPLDNLSVSMVHTIDGEDPFVNFGLTDNWEDHWAQGVRSFMVADQGFSTSRNAMGNTEITLNVPTGYMDLNELRHLYLSVAWPEMDTEDWLNMDWSDFFSFTLTTSTFGMSQVVSLLPQVSDFETNLDFVIDWAFRHGRSHLIPMVQPLDITLTDGEVTLQLLATLGVTAAQRTRVETTTFFSIQGLSLEVDEWGQTVGLVRGPEMDWSSQQSGQVFQTSDAQLIHVDSETDTGYFMVSHSASFFDGLVFMNLPEDGLPLYETNPIPDSLTISLSLEQFVGGRQSEDIVLEADLAALLSTHQATLISRAELEATHLLMGTGFMEPGLSQFLELSVEDSWQSGNLIDAYLADVFVPKPGELDHDLGQDVVLSNIAIQEGLLWVQLRRPQLDWRDVTTPDVWIHVRNTQWNQPPHAIFSLSFAEIDERGFSDVIYENFVFTLDDPSEVANLEIASHQNAYRQFVDLNFSTTFEAPVVQDGFFVQEAFHVELRDSTVEISRVQVDGWGVSFELRGEMPQDVAPADLWTIQWLTAEGISEPVQFEANMGWLGSTMVGGGTVVGVVNLSIDPSVNETELTITAQPVIMDAPLSRRVPWHAELTESLPMDRIVVYLRFPWDQTVNPLALEGVVINGVTIQ